MIYKQTLLIGNVHHEWRSYPDGLNRAFLRTKVAVETGFGISDLRFCLPLHLANAWTEKDVFGAYVPAKATCCAFVVIYFRRHL